MQSDRYTSASCQEHLGVLNEDPVDLQFNHSGYLFLASEDVAHIMEENYNTQRCLFFFHIVQQCHIRTI